MLMYFGRQLRNDSRPSYRGTAGFTLLELMVVVAVAGVLVSMGLPSFREALQLQRTKAVAAEMHLSFLLARSESIKRATNVAITRSAGGWVGGWTVAPGDKSVDAANAISIECSTDSDISAETCPASVTFARSGRPTALIEFRFFMTNEPTVQARCVSVSLSGRPRVLVDTDGNATNGCG